MTCAWPTLAKCKPTCWVTPYDIRDTTVSTYDNPDNLNNDHVIPEVSTHLHKHDTTAVCQCHLEKVPQAAPPVAPASLAGRRAFGSRPPLMITGHMQSAFLPPSGILSDVFPLHVYEHSLTQRTACTLTGTHACRHHIRGPRWQRLRRPHRRRPGLLHQHDLCAVRGATPPRARHCARRRGRDVA